MTIAELPWYDEIVERAPAHLAGSASWAGHVPFAFLLMKCLRPATVVELGVFAGNSLFAFAQAAAELDLAVRIHGIDTWESDPHSGGYDGDAMYRLVDRHRAETYPDRVELHRATFDAARARFAAGSVDLLHIDGYHRYDAVAHDYATWRETLAPRAVVLFHDIAVREGDFGVWRFWDELKATHGAERTFEFSHSNGLGVFCTAPPEAYPPPFAAFLRAGQARPDLAQTVFRLAGARVVERLDRVIAAQGFAAELELGRARAAAERQACREEIIRQTEAIAAQAAELAHLRALLADMLNSRSWRLTAPLRWLNRRRAASR